MENEKRLDLIDRSSLGIGKAKREVFDNPAYADGWNSAIAIIENAPTVDAVVLPCKIGDDVYIIPSKVNFELNVLSGLKKNNRVYHQKVVEIVFTQDCWYARGNADKEFGTGRVLPDVFYKKTWFLTEEEAETALAKMDGGNEDDSKRMARKA